MVTNDTDLVEELVGVHYSLPRLPTFRKDRAITFRELEVIRDHSAPHGLSVSLCNY